MKKLALILLLAAFGLIWAQTGEEDAITADNDQHATDGAATEIITAEPIVVAEIIGNVDPAVADASSSTPEMDMTASMDASYSTYQTKINIPLWYRWTDFSFNASVPYFVSKTRPLAGGEELETSGLGDISIGAAYGRYLDQYNTYLSTNVTIKLPTGDEENTVEDQNGWKQGVPLGSGSTDIAAGLSGFYFMDEFTFKGNLLYKLNGTYETEINDSTKFDTDIGDLFLFTAGADYRWKYRLTFGLDLVYGNRTAAETEGTDQKNGMAYMDVDPSVKYSISLFEFVLGANIPVYTELETYIPWVSESDQQVRSTTITFRTNYRIF